MQEEINHYEIVHSFEELYATSYHDKVNAIGWQRNLEGDFKEIVQKLSLKESITELSIEDLLALDLSENGKKARTVILEDYKKLEEIGASPSLNLLQNYERDTEFDFISTDVYSFHVDRSPIVTDTVLCTYYGACSSIIPNEDVIQQIQVESVREKLKSFYDGSPEDFDEFLVENFFDMHYKVLDNSNIYTFSNGDIWRLAVDHPDLGVPPCIHRAPVEADGKLRLLLIC